MKPDDLTPRFIRTLRNAGLDLTAREIADILWMASITGPAAPPPDLSKAPQTGESGKPDQMKGDDHEPETHPIESGEKRTGVFLPGVSDNTGIEPIHAGVSFRAAAAAALPHKLAISRALRPLHRRVPSRTRFGINEQATVRQIAEIDDWTPVLRPVPDRWLDLAILVDQWPSMYIWREVVKELATLLERQGSFRNCRIWGLSVEDKTDAAVRLHTRWDFGKTSPSVHSLAELKDPSGRRLILIVSDCVAPAWHDGRMARAMAEWGSNSMFAVVQMMPFRHWQRTGLGRAEAVFLRSAGPGIPNARLKTEREMIRFDEEKAEELAVPVVTLEPDLLAPWAAFLSGAGGMNIPGVLLPMNPETADIEDTGRKGKAITPEERLQLFQATASPTAQLLAGYLAVVPLSLPVMHLVQRKMLPRSRQIHLAEVFLSGLIERVTPIDRAVAPESVQYAFVQGVDQQLRQTALVSETVEVIDALSEFLETNQGLCRDFLAALPDPSGLGRHKIKKEAGSFADIKISLLRRFGGIYTKLAGEIETEIILPVKYPRRAEPIEVSEYEFKEVFKLNNTWCPLKYVSNDYKDNQDGTITDHATGLMWQQSGADNLLSYQKRRKYVRRLNHEHFAGYNDWRLPTIDELTSLLEPEKRKYGLYIDPLFDKKPWWCWSSDTIKGSSGLAWVVGFLGGSVSNGLYNYGNLYVRVVRTGQLSTKRKQIANGLSIEQGDISSSTHIVKETSSIRKKSDILIGIGSIGSDEPKYLRRNEPIEVSRNELKKVFQLGNDWCPLKYVPNDYEDNQNGTITDHATGLMWQQSGSDDMLSLPKGKKYMRRLNHERFAGYNDWRLPTIDELTSLLEPEKRKNELYIDLLFDQKQLYCGSSDTSNGSSDLAWVVYFNYGVVGSSLLNDLNYYVRVVRAGQ